MATRETQPATRPHDDARARDETRPRDDGPARRARNLRRTGGAGLAMAVLSLAASVVNYASNIVFSRLLEPASYGDLTALLSLAVVVTVPTAAAQTVVAERVAYHRAHGEPARARYLIRHALAHVGVIALLSGCVYALCIPLVDRLLSLQAVGPAIALMPLITLSFIVPVMLGALQGMERFVAFGVMSLAIAVARVVFGVPWVEAGGGSGGALAGQALGMLVVFVAALVLLRNSFERRGSGAASSGLRRRPDMRSVSASAAFIGFALVSNLDVLLAKAFLPPREVGIYAALATVGKVVIFLPTAIAIILVPNAARAEPYSRDRQRVLRIAAALVAVTTAIFAVPASLEPEFVIRSMFGADYLDATSGVFPIVCAGMGLALLYLLVVYSVTIRDRRWTWLLIGGVVLQVATISAFHSSPREIAIAQACVVLVILTANELAFHSLLRPHRGPPREL